MNILYLVIGIVSTITAVFAVAISVSSLRYSRNRDMSKDNVDQFKSVVKDMINPLERASERNSSDVRDINTRVAPTLLATTDRLNAMSDRVGVLETKVDVFWKDVGKTEQQRDKLLQSQESVVPAMAAIGEALREITSSLGRLERKLWRM